MAKTSKSAGDKNGKKKKNAGPNAKAMKQKTSKPNPFESIWSRRKFDILGKKRKGEERRLGLARSRAIDKVLFIKPLAPTFKLNKIFQSSFLAEIWFWFWFVWDTEEKDSAQGLRAER